jgi:hypothetical protein
MGAKLVIFNDADPNIGMTLEYTAPGTPGRARGWHGSCTQCGKPVHYWREEDAFERGQAHVDSHAV